MQYICKSWRQGGVVSIWILLNDVQDADTVNCKSNLNLITADQISLIKT